MKPTEIADKLEAHNRWRRSDEYGDPAPNPAELGRTLDAAVAALRKLTTAGQAQESYEGVIDCRTCVHLGPMKDCTAPFGCAGGSGFGRRSALQLWRCTKCGGTMAPGVAMGQTVTGGARFPR